MCLQSIDNILQAQAPQLFQSLSQKFGGNLFQITWPLLQTWLSDVTNHEDWAKIVDFLFTDWDKPELTLYLVAMYIMYYKKRLLTLKLRKDVISFFKVKRPLKVKKFMKNVFNLFESAGARTSVVAFNTKLPLSPGQYPLFTGYPKYLVESVDDIADQIRQEQEAKIREKAYVTDIKSRVDNLQEHEDAFQDRTHAVLTAEREKFQRLKLEEKERIEVMKQNDRETREKRLGQIESIEDEGRNYIERQKSRRAALLDKLQSDVEYNQNREAYFQQGLMEEEALNALEYKATQRLLELLKTREAEEAAKKEKIANSS